MCRITCKWVLLVLGCLWIASGVAFATVRVPSLISDNMVLQQGVKARIWGTADPSERVSVSLAGRQAETVAGSDGGWMVEIGPLEADGPFQMVIKGSNTIVVHDVMVGEVWVCSGQSNMEFPVGYFPNEWQTGVLNSEHVIASANYPLIRMFTVTKTVAGRPQSDVKGRWEVTSPATVAHFSAVGYFFGVELFKSLHVPIGLIHSSWGGTPAESWTSRPTLNSDLELRPILENWEASEAKFLTALGNFTTRFDNWKQNAEKAEAEGSPLPPLPEVGNDPRSDPWRPAGLFNAMIMPLVHYPIKGAIWYQGESNAPRGIQYRKLFPAMIGDWRQAWGEGDFPFLFVQLAPFRELPNNWSFPLVREAQLMTLNLSATGMVVTTDIGNPTDIHPKNKQEVGRRLALAARGIAYGQQVVYSGPIYASMTVGGSKIRIHFEHADGGLVTPGGAGLEGFEIAGADRKFATAEATIDGDTVVVSSDRVPHPVAVRYAWENDPLCNLFNEFGLPASPFRTDSWPDPSVPEK